MAFATKLSYLGQFTASEVADTASSPNVSSTGGTRVFDGCNLSGQYSSAGTPALYTRIIDISLTLSGASQDIDLTAAPLASDIAKTVDLTGKKLIGYALKADPANAGNLIVKPAASNGYNLFIGASEQRTLEPGRQLQSMVPENGVAGAAAIDGTHKVITVAGATGYILKALLIFA